MTTFRPYEDIADPKDRLHFSGDPAHLHLEYEYGRDPRDNPKTLKYNWNGTWSDLYNQIIIPNADAYKLYGIDATPIEAALEIRKDDAFLFRNIEQENAEVMAWLEEHDPFPVNAEKDRQSEIENARNP
jgi:hypothetical protein